MTPRFDTTFLTTDTARRARHGKPWSTDEIENMENLFKRGHSLAGLCELLQRPAAGVVPKLEQRGLIQYSGDDSFYFNCVAEKDVKPQTQPEPIMANAPTIETKTFIAGVDASTMSDEQIFKKIAMLESTMDSWATLKNRPTKLTKKLAEIEADIAALVAYVDGRP